MLDDPFDRYGSDVLADYNRRAKPVELPRVEAEFDLVVEEVASDFCGSVVSVEGRMVELEDRHGKRRVFPLDAGFLLEGRAVQLVPPRAGGAGGPGAAAGPKRTASGSIAAPLERARVARPSRIYVEGRHDAELVEKVWGDDLRGEGVVVEYLEGVDDLDAIVREFAPTRSRRVGVLVDHLVPGSKESRIAEAVARGPFGANVLVVGHPYVDIWQSVTPKALGIRAWPTVPRSIEWKHGICEAFGWPHDSQADIARAWKRILSRVHTYTDLEPVLLGRVEQLIDFVTEPE
ncbi:DUF3097 domain-containing protein [Herbiconiux solani]|uniref:DUF3097 domain-containing protein n=1 Tax=Herbiconiux solani TaxID=661329 RepID=UPI0008254AA8|nr:DUF3097 domain-containing protein [Herbiconiux solani]